MHIMPIDGIDDWQRRIERQDAFWDNAIIDRPVCIMTAAKPQPASQPLTPKEWATHRDRWLDFEYIAAQAAAGVRHMNYYGDALPIANPNLGPEVFSCFFGAEMEYGEQTTWSKPCLDDYDQAERLQFSEDNPYWRQLMDLTDALLDAGQGLFYTGLTDFHPGGDAIAAFRDPVNLNMDMIDQPERVKALVDRLTEDYKTIFERCYQKLRAANQAITCWAGIVSSKKWYVPSNDFSCMISPQMFDDIFLPGITEECRFFEASIYHLDGPNALQHLDSLLEIDELNAIQWVYGAGNGRSSDWMDVHKKCQAAGKGIQVRICPDELDMFIEQLKPEGVWMEVWGVSGEDHAADILKRLSQWT